MLSSYMIDSNKIAVDYDGTITNDDGTLNKDAEKYLHYIDLLGFDMFLYTARKGVRYSEAVINIVQWQLPVRIPDPQELSGKPTCIFYIDDRATVGGVIDWKSLYEYLIEVKKQIELIKEKS